MKNIIFWIVSGIIAAAFLSSVLYSCGGGSGSAVPAAGKIAVYMTDNVSTYSKSSGTNDMSTYSEVTGTIERISLVNTGSGVVCDVLTVPMALNVASLPDIMQFLNVTQCLAVPYNRIQIQFDKTVQLMSSQTGTPSLCSFTSYMDEGSNNKPDVLQCDTESNICTLSINGAVNVLASQNSKIALGFNLKDFLVETVPICAVTMKVTPLNASAFKGAGITEAVTGIVSHLSTTSRTFDLTSGNTTFSVFYSETNQPGLDTLLQRAQDDGLRTTVISPAIDFSNYSITATAIVVKVEGTISNLATGATFSVSYGAGETRIISVDYSEAVVVGMLTDGAWAEVKLTGFSETNNQFNAAKVEVETPGTMIQN